MKKKILIIVGIIIVLLVVLVVSGEFEKIIYKVSPVLYGTLYRGGMVYQPKFTSEFHEYVSEKYKASVSYPDGWIAHDNLSPDEVLTPIVVLSETIYSKTPQNHNGNAVAIAFESIDANKQKMSLKELEDTYKKEYEAYPEAKLMVREVADFSVGSHKGFYMIYDTYRGSTHYVTKEVFIPTGSKVYHMTYADLDNEYAATLPTIDKIFNSFKFL